MKSLLRAACSFALSLCACAPAAPYQPLTRYAPIHCKSLAAEYTPKYSTEEADRFSSEGPLDLDPALGWEKELGDIPVDCHSSGTRGRLACAYSAMQERPLNHLHETEAYRGFFDGSLGAKVLVRAVRQRGRAVLVAKVLSRRWRPLGWTTTRELSDAEWQTLIGAWPSLPDARSDYFDPAPLKKSPPARAKLQCLWFDGAGVTIERLRDGKLEVGSARYGSRDDSFCPHECCDPLSRPISRFFDQLAQLVKCERDVTSGGT